MLEFLCVAERHGQDMLNDATRLRRAHEAQPVRCRASGILGCLSRMANAFARGVLRPMDLPAPSAGGRERGGAVLAVAR